MSISPVGPPILKDEDRDGDELEIEAVKPLSLEDVDRVSKVSRNILRPTNVYEDSPLLQFQKKNKA